MTVPSVPVLPPEPWASWIDVVTAAQALETAIHAPSARVAAHALRMVQLQCTHAAAYQQAAGRATQAQQAAMVAAEAGRLATATARTPAAQLPPWQASTLYAFQGVLRALAGAVQTP